MSGQTAGKETYVHLKSVRAFFLLECHDKGKKSRVKFVNLEIRGWSKEKLVMLSISAKRIIADTNFGVVLKHVLFGLILKTLP